MNIVHNSFCITVDERGTRRTRCRNWPWSAIE